MHQHPQPEVASEDPRDLTGPFKHTVEIEVRFADTDAMRHVNNAKYLTYCEIARIRYWTDVTGESFALGDEGAESLILAEARITYRAQTPGALRALLLDSSRHAVARIDNVHIPAGSGTVTLHAKHVRPGRYHLAVICRAGPRRTLAADVTLP